MTDAEALALAVSADTRRGARPDTAIEDSCGNWAVLTMDVFDAPAAWLVTDGAVVPLDMDKATGLPGMEDFAARWRKLSFDHLCVLDVLDRMARI